MQWAEITSDWWILGSYYWITRDWKSDITIRESHTKFFSWHAATLSKTNCYKLKNSKKITNETSVAAVAPGHLKVEAAD